MEKTAKDYSHIKGWGIDADPKNDPTYPMRKRANEDHSGYSWKRPPLQPVNIEVLHSIERPNITAVFGTSAPPSGLSGMLRRYAFQYGEGSFGHWLPLLLADRVNVVEGILDDLKQGQAPNIWAERGMNAEWNYNRKGLLQNLAIGAIVISAAAVYFSRNKD
ncbi:hypothetical protein [Pontibacter pamirensis]|uniref:hypothetical protein n=1 Tax=Pontibacter pamirensis TaxID=2562824 RepID=UPI00138A21D8|nr:hypothetical protein [Pontibacter pamirensis]